MADKNVDYAHVDECPHVDEDVDNLLGEQSTHVSGEQSTSKTLSQLEAHIAKMAETMSRMGDMWGRIATKRDCVDSSPLPFPPKRNRLDDDADRQWEWGIRGERQVCYLLRHCEPRIRPQFPNEMDAQTWLQNQSR